MKHLIISFFILSGFSTMSLSHMAQSQVLNTRHLTEPNLNEGECHTLSDAKYYWKEVMKPTNELARAEIGIDKVMSVQNTDTESYFFCKVKCRLKKANQFFWITNKDSNANSVKMDGFLCEGLDVKDVALSATLTIKTTVATPFSAASARNPDIHNFLASINYEIDPSQLGNYFAQFYSALALTIGVYSTAQSGYFAEASQTLRKFSPEDPESWLNTSIKIDELNEKKWIAKNSFTNLKGSMDLVDLFFVTQGRFLQYIPKPQPQPTQVIAY